MGQTPTPEPAEGQTPQAGTQEPQTGQEPGGTQEPTTEPQAFDADYVKQLRTESAQYRKRLATAEKSLQEIADRDKSEAEKLAEKAAANERKALEAETRATRYEVAADRSLGLDAAAFLTGSTREEIEASADKLAELLAARVKEATPNPRAGFDGGARQTPEQTKPPEQAHNDLLMAALGRTPNPPQ